MERMLKKAGNKKERAILSNIKTVMVVSLPVCITDHVPRLQAKDKALRLNIVKIH